MTTKLSRPKKVAKRPAKRPKKKTLKQLNAELTQNWDEVMRRAKANTLALTGKEVL